MPWLQNPDTGESYWSEGGAPAPAAPAGNGVVLGQSNSGGPGGMVSTARTFESALAEANARGPGWGAAADGRGGYEVVVQNPDQVREGNLPSPGQMPAIPTDPMANRPTGPLTPQQSVAQYGANMGAFEGALTGQFAGRQQTTNRAARAPGVIDGVGQSGGAPAEEQGPATLDRARIDALLGNTSKATAGLMGLGERDLQFSAAQAQLRQGLEQGQRQSLALARSGSRRDRAGNEARAIQANSELSAQTGQAAAGLRATEEKAQQDIKLAAYKAAGDLGLNAGALDLNAQSLDMNAATNFLNQMFQRENLNLQIDQQEAERVTNFVRDMALLSRDYYSLGVQERDAVRQDLTRRYGISETSRVALEQLEASGKVNWEQVGANMLAGAVVGATQVGAKAALGG